MISCRVGERGPNIYSAISGQTRCFRFVYVARCRVHAILFDANKRRQMCHYGRFCDSVESAKFQKSTIWSKCQ